jgi:hypothetical protein
MRVVEEIIFPQFRVTILSWNDKYLIKAESGWLEQTFKIPVTEVVDINEIKEMLSPDWQSRVHERFKEMGDQLQAMLNPY